MTEQSIPSATIAKRLLQSIAARPRLLRVLRHIAFAVAGSATIQSVFEASSDMTSTDSMSLGAAYGGLFFLAATLLVGPVYVLTGRQIPVSSMLRRDLGIWAAVYGLLHVYVGLLIYFDRTMWPYFVYTADEAHTFPLRLDLFGIANYVGLLAALVLVALLGLSNNWSLRKLGPAIWKKGQRWAYAGAVLIAAHGILYQVYEARTLGFVVLQAVVIAIVIGLQLWGASRWRGPQ